MISSFSYKNGFIYAKFRNRDRYSRYILKPRQDRSFNSSGFHLVLLIRYLEKNPGGFSVELDNVVYSVIPSATPEIEVPKLGEKVDFVDPEKILHHSSIGRARLRSIN